MEEVKGYCSKMNDFSLISSKKGLKRALRRRAAWKSKGKD